MKSVLAVHRTPSVRGYFNKCLIGRAVVAVVNEQ